MAEDYKTPVGAAPPDWRGQAQPEPEVVGPSDKGLVEAANEAGLCYPQCWDFESQPERLEHLRTFARAVLARWGNHFPDAGKMVSPAPVPVAVSERLPGAEDCDAEGRCWVHQPHYLCPESPAWELMSAKYASANYEAVCWLPANALPLPSGEVEP